MTLDVSHSAAARATQGDLQHGCIVVEPHSPLAHADTPAPLGMEVECGKRNGRRTSDVPVEVKMSVDGMRLSEYTRQRLHSRDVPFANRPAVCLRLRLV